MEMSIRFPNLGIGLDYVGKSIRIFGFEITFYGLLIAIGMILGVAFVILEARRCNENPDQYLSMIIVSLLTGLIGARLLYVAFSWDLYKNDIVQIFNIRGGGMAFYGGLLGGILGAALYCGLKKLSFMRMADTASMGILIAQIIGRWGDFFNRESFGEYTNSIFAMQLPLSSVRSGEVTSAMRENLETIGGISYIQVHPVFLYESMWCLLLFLAMLVWKRKKRFHGEVFLRYLSGYGLGRFFFEWLRTDKLLFPGTELGVSQVISASLFLVCGLEVIVRRSMAKKRAALKKRRREQDYEAQERAAREAEKREAQQSMSGWEELMEPDGHTQQPDRQTQQPDGQDKADAPPAGEETPPVSEASPAPADPVSSAETGWLGTGPRRFTKKPPSKPEA